MRKNRCIPKRRFFDRRVDRCIPACLLFRIVQAGMSVKMRNIQQKNVNEGVDNYAKKCYNTYIAFDGERIRRRRDRSGGLCGDRLRSVRRVEEKTGKERLRLRLRRLSVGGRVSFCERGRTAIERRARSRMIECIRKNVCRSWNERSVLQKKSRR